MAKYALEANQESAISAVGRYFRIFTSSTDLKVRIYGQGREYYSGKLAAGVGIEFTDLKQYPAPFDRILVSSETGQTVDLWHELAKADDDRLSGNFDINAALTVANTAPRNNAVSLQNISAATEVLTFRQSRKSALIQTSGEVYVQNTNGVKLSGNFSWENQSALTLVPVTGTIEVRISEDFD